eukprot:28061-Eustigmatos_ZCMA.PRE.1
MYLISSDVRFVQLTGFFYAHVAEVNAAVKMGGRSPSFSRQIEAEIKRCDGVLVYYEKVLTDAS